MDLWLQAISNIGFPAVITLYLLSRIEKKLDTLNDSIRNLPNQWAVRQTEPKRSQENGLTGWTDEKREG